MLNPTASHLNKPASDPPDGSAAPDSPPLCKVLITTPHSTAERRHNVLLATGRPHANARRALMRGAVASPWLVRADVPWTKDLRVVQSDSQMRFLTSVWMSSMLCCTAADSILLRKPVLNKGPDLHTQVWEKLLSFNNM